MIFRYFTRKLWKAYLIADNRPQSTVHSQLGPKFKFIP